MTRFRLNKSAAARVSALRQLMRTAVKRFPFYRSLFHSAGVSPDEIRTLSDIRRLPIVSKEDLLTRLWVGCMDTRSVKRHEIKWTTSGTSGPVMLVHMSAAESFYRSLSYLRAMQTHTRFSWPLTIAHAGAGERESHRTRQPVHRLTGVTIAQIRKALPMDKQVDALIQAHGHIVTGNPTTLEALALRMIELGIKSEPQLVVSRGEILTDRVKETLTGAFTAKVIDSYNAEEIGCIAFECPADSRKMHVNTDCCVLEILDEDGMPQPVGTEGRIVVTNLFNHTMPVLRFDLGDRGTLISEESSRCTCGLRLPTMMPPAGRTSDYFRFPLVSFAPRAVESLVVPEIQQAGPTHECAALSSTDFQVVQEDGSRVRLALAGHVSDQEALRTNIERNFLDRGAEISLVIHEGAHIEPEDSGKSRRVFSEASGSVEAPPEYKKAIQSR